MLTKGAIGNLVNRYRAVLKKCNLINTFGSLAVASMLVLGGAGVASAAEVDFTGSTYTLNNANNASSATITTTDSYYGVYLNNDKDSNNNPIDTVININELEINADGGAIDYKSGGKKFTINSNDIEITSGGYAAIYNGNASEGSELVINVTNDIVLNAGNLGINNGNNKSITITAGNNIEINGQFGVVGNGDTILKAKTITINSSG
ncbi:MAG: hypothetical protein IJY48_06810, partial [Mailhella sp.]|nr:hypothetical protein [Mailhella sp.]